MYPHVCAPYVDAVEATPVPAPDRHVVHLAVGAGIHREMERRGIDEGEIMDGEISDFVQAQVACAGAASLSVDLVAVT